jgi:hypothetical protein
MNGIWQVMLKEVSDSRKIAVDSLNAYADRFVTLANQDDYVKLKLVDKLIYTDEVKGEIKKMLKIDADEDIHQLMLSDMEGAQPISGRSYDAIPPGQIIELNGLALDAILYQVEVQKDVRIMVYPDYAKFYQGESLLDITVKKGTTVTPQGVTAINAIRKVDNDKDSPYYDLQGRRLNGKPNKGIYIKNGKIFMQ